jgi:hypothetical protein
LVTVSTPVFVLFWKAASFRGLVKELGCLARSEFPDPRTLGRVDHAQSRGLPDRRRNERQQVGMKERLTARDDELVADVAEKAPCPTGWLDDQNDRP